MNEERISFQGISVCMATYNGEKYVAEQISSILTQLSERDELIIVDDCSSDLTRNIIANFNDQRIKLYINDKNYREVYSFSKAISQAKNAIVFLSDQDDIWNPGRVNLMLSALMRSRGTLLTSNFDWINSYGEQISIKYDGVHSLDSRRWCKNILDIYIGKTNYYGCAMLLRKDLLGFILPIPKYVESHDLWIAMAGNMSGSNLHIDQRTFKKRQHATNTTSTISTRPTISKIWSRVIFTISLIHLLIRKLRVRRYIPKYE